MGIGGFTNFPPSLEPPSPLSTDGKVLKKDAEKGAEKGAVPLNPKEKHPAEKGGADLGNFIYQDGESSPTQAAEQADEQQQQQDQGGGGGSQGGSSDNSSGGDSQSGGGFSQDGNTDFNVQLFSNLENDSDPASQVYSPNVASVFTDSIGNATGQIVYAGKYTTANSALNAGNLNQLQSELPVLSPTGDFQIAIIRQEAQGNPCLNSIFIVTITANLMEVVKQKKNEHFMSGMLTAKMMTMTYDYGVALGDLAMEKAELEAEQHIAQMWVAIAGFGMAVLGTGMTIGAMGAKTAAEGVVLKNSLSKDSVGAGGKTTTSFKESGVGSTQTFKQGQVPSSSSASAKETGATSTKGDGAESKITIGSSREKSSTATAEKAATSKAEQKTTDKEKEVETEQVKDAEVKQTEATKVEARKSSIEIGKSRDKSAADKEAAKTPETSKEKNAENAGVTTTSDGAKLSKSSTKSGAEKINEQESNAEAGPAAGQNVEGTLTPKEQATLTRAEKIIQGASYAEELGKMLTLGGGASQLASAADHLVQAIYATQIGAKEREMEIVRALQKVLGIYGDSLRDQNSAASDAIKSALDLLMKIQDENARTFSMNRS